MTRRKHEVAVVGGGLAGYAAAVGFALGGFDVVHLAPTSRPDRRSTALIGSSATWLDQFGIMRALGDRAQAMAMMRLVDDTGRLVRAPTVEFRASEIDRPAFGYNVLNEDLLQALRSKASELSDRLMTIDDAITDVVIEPDGAALETRSGGQIRCRLVVGADGRRSVVRAKAGIGLQTWTYPQTAIVLNFAHERPHHAVSTEFHTATGPFTQVPLAGDRSSLVWVDDPAVAELVKDVDPKSLAMRVEAKLHSILGRVTIEDGLQSFPLSGATAHQMTAPRIALIGEAAHVFPPIGAQGLNLGLRDAANLIETAKRYRDDPGGRQMLVDYAAGRQSDVSTRTKAVDLLNRSLLSDFLPVQALRSVGLGVLAHWPTARRALMREGIEPGSALRRDRASAFPKPARPDQTGLGGNLP